MSCYEIDDYVCEERSSYMNITNHPASIRLTKNMLLKETPAPPDFPVHYFNLCEYDELCQRIDRKDLLTDYAGRLDGVNSKTTASGKKLLRMNMTDISKETIEITVWEEIIPRFDYAKMEDAEKPMLAVITSTIVSTFLAIPQLASTQATHFYFNPETETTTALRYRFKQEAPILPISTERYITGQQPQTTTTISHIQEHRAKHRHRDKAFVCEATITNIPERRAWYYRECPICRRKVYIMKGKFSFGEHDDIKEPNLMFTVNATITDTIGSAMITMFDDAVKTLLGTQCKKMILEEGYDDPNTLPKPILALKGQPAVFHIHYTAGSYNLKVNHATPRPIQTTLTHTPQHPKHHLLKTLKNNLSLLQAQAAQNVRFSSRQRSVVRKEKDTLTKKTTLYLQPHLIFFAIIGEKQHSFCNTSPLL